jgi:retron-type reverse transcriptase
MTNLINDHLSYLTLLKDASTKQRRALLIHASPEQFKALIEVIYNILRGNISISDSVQKRLYRYRVIIRQLVDRSVNKKEKHRLLRSNHFIIPSCIEALVNYLKVNDTDDLQETNNGEATYSIESRDLQQSIEEEQHTDSN